MCSVGLGCKLSLYFDVHLLMDLTHFPEGRKQKSVGAGLTEVLLNAFSFPETAFRIDVLDC